MTIANASVTIGPTYTLAMVDPMAVGASTDRVVRHWLVNGVQIGNNSELVFPADAKIITAYRGLSSCNTKPVNLTLVQDLVLQQLIRLIDIHCYCITNPPPSILRVISQSQDNR